MNQQNYDQQQIHNPNQNFLQQQSQGNVSSGNSLPVIASPFQVISSNSNVGDIMTMRPSQHQQSINNHYSLNPNSNFNNNHDSNLSIHPSNCGNVHHGTRNKNGDDPLVTMSRHMLIIKDYMVKIEHHCFELEQILSGLRRYKDDVN